MAGTSAGRLGTLAVGVTLALGSTVGVATRAAAATQAGPLGMPSATALGGSAQAVGSDSTAMGPPREVRGAPVDSTLSTLTQPDGTTFTAVQHGDAVSSWWTAKGATIARSAGGTWRFATGLDASGQPAPVGTAVSPAAAAPAAAVGLSPTEDAVASQTDPAMPSLGFTGQQRTLVILAQFLDRASVGTTPAQWNARFFGATDSVRAFYRGASSGNLDLTPATETSGTANDGVIGWVGLPINHPNYFNNIDSRAQDVTARAIKAADPYIDYASYDTNHNGVIEPVELHLTIIAAGYEGAYGGTSACTPNVWGHRWAVTSGAPVVDGTTVGSRGYTQFGESHCTTGNRSGAHQATIGIMAHEFGHDLGWPDLYDTDGTSEGVGEWSLMASGSWGTKASSRTPGDAPVLPDAWSRSVQGWVAPVEVTATANVSLPEVSTTDTVYRMLNDPNGPEYSKSGTGEYFLVENRQNAGLDTALPGCGLLVYHVHEGRTGNDNDADRLVDVVEADGLEGLNQPANRGGAGDAWHGISSHRVLTSSTVPSTRLNVSGTSTTVRMTAKGACAPTMSATLTGAWVTPATGANDALASAEPITGSAGTATGSNGTATKEPGEPSHAGDLGGASIWYRWTAPSNGTLALTTSGSGIDTLLGLYTGSSAAALTTVASNDDDAGLLTSRISGRPVTAGVTYRIAVDGWGGGQAPSMGETRLEWSFTPSIPPPDTAAPVLSSFDFSPSGVDVTAGPADVLVTARVTDATGAVVPTLVLSSDSTAQVLGAGTMTLVAGTTVDGTYQRTVSIPATAATGSWTVTVNALADTLGNTESTSHAHPQKLTVTRVTAPGAATGVTAVAGNGQASVSWQAPVSTGGAAVTGYTVTSSPGAKTCTTTSALGCTVTGLTNGTGYTFTVTATNRAGTGPASSPSAGVTPLGAPGAPTGVTAVAGNGQASVSWLAPVSDGGAPITRYTVTSSPGARTCTTASGLSCAVTGLSNGTGYTFTVTATNGAGTGVASAASATVTPDGPVSVPGAPTGVAAVVGNGLALVSWSAPASEGGAAINGYTVTGSPGGLTCTTAGLGCTVSGLSNGTGYTFTVTATNSAGTGPASVPSGAVTPRFVPNGSGFTAVSPKRVLDTRAGTGAAKAKVGCWAHGDGDHRGSAGGHDGGDVERDGDAADGDELCECVSGWDGAAGCLEPERGGRSDDREPGDRGGGVGQPGDVLQQRRDHRPGGRPVRLLHP